MVTLSDEDVVVLREALDRYLPELSFELSRVKVVRDRHPLVVLEQRLRDLRARLENEPADAHVT